MISSKKIVLNGLYLTVLRPIHPLVLEYLSRRGFSVYIEDGFLTVDGNGSLPNEKTIFAELTALSKELHGKVIFDLETHYSQGGYREFEVVNKKPVNPGIFAYFSSFIFGNSKETTKDTNNPAPSPKP